MKFNILAILFLCYAYNATAQITVYDINKTTANASSNPYNLTTYNDKLYFMATNATHGHELWAIDSVTGEYMVADINPGAANASPNKGYGDSKDKFAVAYVTEMQKNILYFIADDGVHGNELWMYDGVNPPSIAKEVVPGTQGLDDVLSMAAGNGYVFFYENFKGIWVYNVNTRTISIIPGTHTLGQLQELVFHNGNLYTNVYRKGSSSLAYSLWHYNPVTGDSGVVKTDLQSIAGITPLNNKLFYHSNGIMYEYEVNKPFKTVPSVRVSYLYKQHGIFNNKLYLTDTSNNVFEYNPATAKTRLVFEHDDYWIGNGARFFTQHDNKMFFVVADTTHGYELWEWDGTNLPKIAADVNPGKLGSNIHKLRSQKDGLYFIAQTPANGREVYRYRPSTTSVQNLSFKGEVRAYPNPTATATTLEIQLSKAQTLHVDVYNMEGKKVLNVPPALYSSGTSRVGLDMRNLPSGNYFYHLRNNENATMVSGKLVKL